jgi:hypothetical protein
MACICKAATCLQLTAAKIEDANMTRKQPPPPNYNQLFERSESALDATPLLKAARSRAKHKTQRYSQKFTSYLAITRSDETKHIEEARRGSCCCTR